MKKPGDNSTVSRESLERIARTLDAPVATFFAPCDDASRDAETLALVRAFDRIDDPLARARCVSFVTAEAARS